MGQSRRHPLIGFVGRFALLDVLRDASARPVLLYAGFTVAFSAAAYRWIEGWGWLDSLYFVVITTTTIGFGDLTPETRPGKVLTIFVALNGVAILLMLLDEIRRVRVENIRDKTGRD